MRKRPYGHREFLKWLRQERKQFQNPPVITRSGYDMTEFLFEGIDTAVRGFFRQQSRSYSQLSVWVKWNDDNVDFIFDIDMKEQCTVDGYSCSFCLPECCVNYPKRKDLFVNHSFEIFLEWCNEHLSQSNWLEIYYQKDYVSSVKLLKDKLCTKDEMRRYIPLHTRSKSENILQQKTYVIPDIHGCNKTFRYLLFNIIRFEKNDTLFLLGDYIDRGPDSKGVIDTILELQRDGYDVRPIRGNHEDMIIDALKTDTDDDLILWLDNGGRETLKSYQIDSLHEMPIEHQIFLKNLPLYLLTETHVFVHAGLDFGFDDPIAATSDNFMLWGRLCTDTEPHNIDGKIVVTGHTIRNIDVIIENLENNFIQLDNGCYMGNCYEGKGNLLALELNSGKLFMQEYIG